MVKKRGKKIKKSLSKKRLVKPKGRKPSNKTKETKIKKLIKLSKSKSRKKKKKSLFSRFFS